MAALLELIADDVTWPPPRTSPILAKRTATGCCGYEARHQGRPDPAAASRREGHEPRDRHPHEQAYPAHSRGAQMAAWWPELRR